MMKSLAKVVKISKEFDRFDNWLHPKSFISLVQTKDYSYIVTDDSKVLCRSSYIIHIS